MEREIIYKEIVEFCKNDEATDKAVDRILDLFSVSGCDHKEAEYLVRAFRCKDCGMILDYLR